MTVVTPTGETEQPIVPKTETIPTVAPAMVNTEDNAVEELRKKLEQSEMRGNQLANQLKTKEEAEAKAVEEELTEQNQYKELHEQEKAKREALEAEIADKDKTAELNEAKTNVLVEYSEEVKSLAEDVGLSLIDTDETSVATFKEKLDKIKDKVVSTGKVNSNNPSLADVKFELSGEELQIALQNKDSFHDIVTKKYPGIASMTTPKA